jgi:hypothetical protein
MQESFIAITFFSLKKDTNMGERVRLRAIAAILVVLIMLVVPLTTVRGDMWDPFHTKEEKMTMWKALWDSSSNTEYFTVGKHYDGSDILLFAAGNPNGGRVLWDGEMHGNEDKGSELLYMIADWLLLSNETQAASILENNYVMFIPQVNTQTVRGNGDIADSPYGVDLNRNFAAGWTKSNVNDDIYSGPNAISEPETKAMRNVFSAYQPTFYVNMHVGAGPYAAYYAEGNVTLSQQVSTRTREICQELGITPYRTMSFGSQGYAMGDAATLGVSSAWLIECVGETTAWRHLPEHFTELTDVYFPKCKALFISMCELSAPPSGSHPKVVFLNQEPPQNQVTSHQEVQVFATVTPSTHAVQNVVLEYTVNTFGHFQESMTQVADSVWMGKIPSDTGAAYVDYSVVVKDESGHTTTSNDTGTSRSFTVLPSPTPQITPHPTPTITTYPPPTATPNPTQPPQNTPSPSPSATPTPTPTTPTNPGSSDGPTPTPSPSPTPNPSPEPSVTPQQEPTPTQESKEASFQPLYIVGALVAAAIIVPTILIAKKTRSINSSK